MLSVIGLMRSVVCFAFFVLAAPLLRAVGSDPLTDLAAFSVFPQIDPAELLKGDIKAARGPAMSDGRCLSVQSCYIISGSPTAALAALRGWSPTSHPELKVFLHADLPSPPTPGSFEKLRSAPNNGAVRALVANTEKGSNELQLSAEEAKALPKEAAGGGPMPEAVSAFWAGVLNGRAQAFVSGGSARQPAYDFSTGNGAKPGEALSRLVRQQEKIRKQFSAFLSESGVTGGKPSLKPELYYELVGVEDDGVLTLGAFASRPIGNGFQAADILYYASGGYDVALTLYQMWPIDAGGQPATLIWRGDLISAASLASLHGVEKIASESATIKDITRTVSIFKRDTAGGR